MKLLTLFVMFALSMVPNLAGAATKPAQKAASSLNVIKIPLAKGVGLDEAVDSMKLRANSLNMKLVSELPLSKEVEVNLGKPQRRMTIFQFCDALTAKQMVDFSIEFAAYLPCRIALIEDANGQGWLLMYDLNVLINAGNLNKDLKKKAIEVRDMLNSIIKAGANGEL